MKKLFVMLLSLTVLAFPAFAQKKKTAELMEKYPVKKLEKAFPKQQFPNKVYGEYYMVLPSQQQERLGKVVSSAMSKDFQKIKEMKASVLKNLADVRTTLENRSHFNGSFIMQDMAGLMDSYLALAKVNEMEAVSLNPEINRPVAAGWGKTVTIAQLVRDNIHYVTAGTTTADDFDSFEGLLGKKLPADEVVVSYAIKTLQEAPSYIQGEEKEILGADALAVFQTYVAANAAPVAEEAFKPLADLLAGAASIKRIIRNTPEASKRESFAAQSFFSSDMPGKYAALQEVNPKLAAATNNLMKSFMETVANGIPQHMPQKDIDDYRAFAVAVGY